jgi:hypothetical protein
VARPEGATPEGAAADVAAPHGATPVRPTPEVAGSGLDLRTRGSIVHTLLEDLDFARPEPPDADTVLELGAEYDLELTEAEVADIQGLVAAFAASPLCERLATASRPRREAPFSFALEPGGGGPLVTGFVDVLARTPDGGALIVDYKTDRLEGSPPVELVERDYATQRSVYALAALSDGAPTPRSPTASSRRPASRSARRSPSATRRRSPSASSTSPKACSRLSTRSPTRPTATCAATAPGAPRSAPMTSR